MASVSCRNSKGEGSEGGKHLGGHFWQRDELGHLCASLSLRFRLCSCLSLFLHDAPQNSGIYKPSPFLGPPFVLWKPGSLGGCAIRGPVRSCQVRQLRVVGPAGLPETPFPLLDMQRYFFPAAWGWYCNRRLLEAVVLSMGKKKS